MSLPALTLVNLGLSMAGKAAKALSDSETTKPAAPPPRDPKLWKQSTEFEAMFLESMLGQMVEGVKGDGPFGTEGTGGDIYRSMLTREHAGAITRSGGVGIADSIYSTLLSMQEKSNGA